MAGMEGVRRGGRWAGAALVCMLALLPACGDGGKIATGDPARTFAPIVYLHPDERFMPVSARWFIARSALWLADDQGCEDRKISVGKRLKAQQNEITDWTFLTGIGWGPAYWREANDARCEPRNVYRYYANQLTRPYEDSPDRAADLRLTEGYYLDLMDWARPGVPASATPGGHAIAEVPAWYAQRRTEVDGEPGLRLVYWFLYGFDEPRDSTGRPIERLAHEGDWERVELLLRGGEGSWEPVQIELARPYGSRRTVPWDQLGRQATAASGEEDDDRTHPVLFAARGSHTLYHRPGRHSQVVDLPKGRTVKVQDDARGVCQACPRIDTAARLLPVRVRHWFGFGGAWGEPGRDSFTTGPLGPHGRWPDGTHEGNLRRAEQHPRKPEV